MKRTLLSLAVFAVGGAAVVLRRRLLVVRIESKSEAVNVEPGL